MSNSLSAFGFLTILEDQQHGFFGGYLLLSALGRPLEFHCSTPILPSQAQRILYGSNLRSFVLGELIGQTLVRKAQLPVHAVLTDLPEMLSMGLFWDGTLACVSAGEAESEATTVGDPASTGPVLECAGFRLVGSATCSWAAEELREALEPLVAHVDLDEPFERIREAIQEAQRVTQPSAPEVDDHPAAA
ncbi:MAG: hypothetical protein AAGD11_20355 [Planctomycetota bacterium]